jgi:hypothetical protein
LVELGVGLRPMPTERVSKVFNEIRHDIVVLLDLQKHIAAKEYEVQILKDQKAVCSYLLR